MAWLEKLARQTGLMIHHIVKPANTNKRVVRHDVEEKKINETTTLRRTTIEEIEVSNKPTDASKNHRDERSNTGND